MKEVFWYDLKKRAVGIGHHNYNVRVCFNYTIVNVLERIDVSATAASIQNASRCRRVHWHLYLRTH